MSVRHKTRTKLRRGLRERSTIRRAVQTFDPGATVHIGIDPSIHKGMPHPRFTGTTGRVVERRGRAYVVQIREGHKTKTLLIRPEHLRPPGASVSPHRHVVRQNGHKSEP